MAGHIPNEKQWKRIQEVLAAEASGKQPRPFVSQRTLFGIKSSVETQIEAIVEEDEAARRARRRDAVSAGQATETTTSDAAGAETAGPPASEMPETL